MFTRILLAIDDSPSSDVAVSFATAMARQSVASVRVVHVNEYLVGGRGFTIETHAEAMRHLEGAVRALRRIHLRRRLELVQHELNKPGVGDDKTLRNELLLEKDRLSRALRDPGLAEDGLRAGPRNQKTA